MWTAAGMREANKRGAGGSAGVAARILLDPDPVLVGKHGANIEFRSYSISKTLTYLNEKILVLSTKQFS
jgi:hypothetical protein